MLTICSVFDIILLVVKTRGSVGTGRRARLRILCSLRACGFKSRLPHPLKESNQVIGCSFLLYTSLELLQPIAGYSILNVPMSSLNPWFKVSSPQVAIRSVRWEKGPLDLFLYPPHPAFRIFNLELRKLEKSSFLSFLFWKKG